MIQDLLKGMKDSLAGVLVMALGLLTQGIPLGAKVTLVIAGAVVAVLGVVTNVVTKDFSPVTTWGKVAKDFILALIGASIPIIQHGAESGQALVGILFGILVAGCSVFSNVLSTNLGAGTILSKIVKDFAVAGSLALGTTFEATQGQPFSVVLSSVGVALLAVFTNTIKSNFLGLDSKTAGGPGAKPGETWI